MTASRSDPDVDLDLLRRQTFDSFLNEANPASGLVVDKTAENWPASIAATGLALACYPVDGELTGAFAPLPLGVVQVESGLKVSFESLSDLATRAETFVPVGWAWCDGESVPVAACEMVAGADSIGLDDIKHKIW